MIDTLYKSGDRPDKKDNEDLEIVVTLVERPIEVSMPDGTVITFDNYDHEISLRPSTS